MRAIKLTELNLELIAEDLPSDEADELRETYNQVMALWETVYLITPYEREDGGTEDWRIFPGFQLQKSFDSPDPSDNDWFEITRKPE